MVLPVKFGHRCFMAGPHALSNPISISTAYACPDSAHCSTNSCPLKVSYFFARGPNTRSLCYSYLPPDDFNSNKPNPDAYSISNCLYPFVLLGRVQLYGRAADIQSAFWRQFHPDRRLRCDGGDFRLHSRWRLWGLCLCSCRGETKSDAVRLRGWWCGLVV